MTNRLTVLAADVRAAHADIQRGAQAIAERANCRSAAVSVSMDWY